MIKQKMCRLLYICGIFLLVNSVQSLPVENEESTENNETSTEPANETAQNLYVIKSVVYEIGILTDAGNDNDTSNETHEEVDLSFFDPGHNGSLIDLSNIPIPIQTNISGVTVTGILPADLGLINLNENGTASLNGSHFPILPNKQIRVTHNISTSNKNESSILLSGLPKILGLDKVIKTSNGEGKEEVNEEGKQDGKEDEAEDEKEDKEKNVEDKDDEAKAS